MDIIDDGQKDTVKTAEMIREIDQDINIVIAAAPSESDLLELNSKVAPGKRLLCVKKPVKAKEFLDLTESLSTNWIRRKKNSKLWSFTG